MKDQQYEYTGTIHHIGQTQTFPSGFRKRTLVLVEDPTAEYKHYAAFDFIKGKTADLTITLDRYRVGQKVSVTFRTGAMESKKQQGSWFVNNTAVKIEALEEVVTELVKDRQAEQSSTSTAANDDMPF